MSEFDSLEVPRPLPYGTRWGWKSANGGQLREGRGWPIAGVGGRIVDHDAFCVWILESPRGSGGSDDNRLSQ